MSAAVGFAVCDGRGIRVATVAATAFSAKVNWLATDGGFLAPRNAPDALIDELFERAQARIPALRVSRVLIEEANA